MRPFPELTKQLDSDFNLAVIIDPAAPAEAIASYCNHEPEADYVKRKISQGSDLVVLSQLDRKVYFLTKAANKQPYQLREDLRRKGNRLFALLKEEQTKIVQITSAEDEPGDLLAVAEGLLLGSYEFDLYKKHSLKKAQKLDRVELHSQRLEQEQVEELINIVLATFSARDLVNEPPNVLHSVELAQRFLQFGDEAGFRVEIFNRRRIEELNMGGLLAVNKGSAIAPTFTVMEHKPENAQNEQPYILVGKGIVYDTGGLSIKPTPNSMDYMKSDMAGAAAVAGAMYAIAANQLPLYVVALIPSTDNNISATAFMPGDIITMMSGKTVEIRNTDAEGRLILADALSYAAQYNPQLVIDLATLTGSAMRAIGPEGIVYMGTAGDDVKAEFEEAGRRVYERLVEFPLWDEYDEQIKSDIADLKNLGGENAGAITAGKFLQHFTSYDWLHLDIAASAYLFAPDHYRSKNGTGVGVRLLYDFLKSRVNA